MGDVVARVVAAAAAAGVHIAPRRYPQPTRTAEDAARAIGCTVDRIVKSLVFIADGEPVLVLVSGRDRVDEGRLAAVVGAREVRRADPEEVRAATGAPIGGVPPFGHPRPLRTLVDRRLVGSEEVYAAAGRPDTNFGIAPADLLRITGADIVDVT